LYKWYNLDGERAYHNLFKTQPPKTFSLSPAKGETNRCVSKLGPSDIIDPSNVTPSIVQSIVNVAMKNMAKYPESTNRGILAWHSTGSGKTCTGTGVIEAFWDGVTELELGGGVTTTVPKDIIFASSLSGLAANSEKAFAACARRFYDRFKTPKFAPPKSGSDAERANVVLEKVVAAMKSRNVRFLSFAKLSNRIDKTEEFKARNMYPEWYDPSTQRGGAAKKGRRKSQDEDDDDDEEETPKAKRKPVAKKGRRKSQDDEDEDEDEEETPKAKRKPVAKKGRRKSRDEDDEEDDEDEDDFIVPNKKAKKRGAAPDFVSVPRDKWVDLDNTILIIDEVQDIFKPISGQGERYDNLKKHLTDISAHPTLKVVVLTATPGDSVDDVLNLLNMVRHADAPKITAPKDYDDAEERRRFSESVRGLVSFLDMNHDTTKFPAVEDPRRPTEYPMSSQQFEEYAKAYMDVMKFAGKDEANDPKNWDALVAHNKADKYWEKARKFANSMAKFEEDMGLFSSKLPALVDKIQEHPQEKHYVYSSFATRARGGDNEGVHGIYAVADALAAMGYKHFTLKQAQKFMAARTEDPDVKMKPAKRFLLVTQKDVGAPTSSNQSQKAQMQAANNLKVLVDLYNSHDNRNGELVQVMLASDGYNQGVDLQAVRHIHIFEPLLKLLSDKQTIGRAARHCSHADLNMAKGEWTVKIHRYAMGLPEIMLPIQVKKGKGKKAQEGYASVDNIDLKVFKEAKERGKELFLMYTWIQEAAIDCRVLYRFHKKNDEAYGHLKCFDFAISPQEEAHRKGLKVKRDAMAIKRKEDLDRLLKDIIDQNMKRQKVELDKENLMMEKFVQRIQERRVEMEKALEEKKRELEEQQKAALKEWEALIDRQKRATSDLHDANVTVTELKRSIKTSTNKIEHMKATYKNNISVYGGPAQEKLYTQEQANIIKYRGILDSELDLLDEAQSKLDHVNKKIEAHKRKYPDFQPPKAPMRGHKRITTH